MGFALAILYPQHVFIVIPGEHACMSCFHGYSIRIPEFVLSYPMHLLARSLTGVLLSPEFILSYPMHLLVRSLIGVRHDRMINQSLLYVSFALMHVKELKKGSKAVPREEAKYLHYILESKRDAYFSNLLQPQYM